MHVCQVTQSCATLCDPMDCSSPGSSVHGILQARVLQWVAMPSSRNLPNPGTEPVSPAAPALQVNSLPLSHQGSPQNTGMQGAKKHRKLPELSFFNWSLL